MTELPICPCEGLIHPRVIFNPPIRKAIAYRIGDYSSFRHALLLPLKTKDSNGNWKVREAELTNWNPSAEGDLAVQIIEWWAYLADILTFYSDRIANESYLRTADLPESVQQLVRILGYRPRPGIGASGILAAIANNSKPFSLPQGFQIQSKPSQGKQPQIFELDTDMPIQFPSAIAAEPVANPSLLKGNSVLLQGSINTVKTGDQLLLLKKDWDGSTSGYALVIVQKIDLEKDARGKVNTRVSFTSTPSLANANAEDYSLLKSDQYAQVWQYPTGSTPVIDNKVLFLNYSPRQTGRINQTIKNLTIQAEKIDPILHLSSLVRQIRVNDPILLLKSKTQSQLIQVTQSKEVVWYAKPKDANDPTSRVDPPDIPIPIPHTQLSFSPSLKGDWDSAAARATILVYYGWQSVGKLIPTPTATFSGTQPKIIPTEEFVFPLGKSQLPLLLEGADGNGLAANVSVSNPIPTLQLSDLSDASISLKPPLQMLFNLLSVSRGQSVPVEILGSGNASIAGQEFVLKKSPLTYLLSGDSSSGGNYKSTLRIWVDGIEWKEVPSFYGQSPDARIFVTREDENQQTHVQFGDRINGARLTSGVNNVVAQYRYGSGKDAPDAGELSVIVKPYPNLKSIRNPVPVGGGADPESPEQIRRYAPQSVLTFGRAVSGDDYEAIAAQTPGVSRAKIYWTWDATQQRSLVKLYVGDDDIAVAAAKIALKGTADPNRSVAVELAKPRPVKISLTLKIESNRIPETVIAAVQSVLLDPDIGLFGANAMQIGQVIYQSQIYAVCMQVSGVIAVHGLEFWVKSDIGFTLDSHYRHDPGEGRFYQLLLTDLNLPWEVN